MEDTLITLCLFHGGVIKPKGNSFTYEGGSVTKLTPFDLDKFSYFELKGIAKDCGYNDPVDFYYKRPRVNIMDSGWVQIVTDDDAQVCIDEFNGLFVINIYCDHGIDPHIPIVDGAISTQPSQISQNSPKVKKTVAKGPRKKPKIQKHFIKITVDSQTESPTTHPKAQTEPLPITETATDPLPIPETSTDPSPILESEMEYEGCEGEDEFSDETDIDDVETSDDEWVAIKDKVNEFRQERLNEMRKGKVVDEESGEKIKLKKVDKRTNFQNFQWELGLMFGSLKDLQDVVVKYSVLQGYNLKLVVSYKKMQKYRINCTEGCPFYVYVSWDNVEWSLVVKTLNNEHRCHRDMANNTQLKAPWCAEYYIVTFKEKPDWSAKEIMSTIKLEFGVGINKWRAYNIRHYASHLLHGSMKEHYCKFGGYVEELKRKNPTSMFLLLTTPAISQSIPVFQRFFVCFDALRRGLLFGCRRVLVIDAAFLKTFLGGTILAATGVDGNNQMFPVAWAVAEGENNESWEWFLTNVKQAIETTDGEGWTLISDQHHAIHHAVATVLPQSEHRNCARHIYANWKKQHRGEEMRSMFWETTKAYSVEAYNEALDKLKQESAIAASDFIAQDPNTFCRAFVNTDTKCTYVVSNMAETFNSYIVRARAKHLMYMLEDIRLPLMERMVEKRRKMEASNDIVCPRIRKKLEFQREKSRKCKVYNSNDTQYEVHLLLDVVVVDLEAGTCTCRRWDLSGIPCCHTIACAGKIRKPAEDYLSPYYKKEKYMLAYGSSINACVGEKYWPKMDTPLDPPKVKVGPGRPKKNRRKDPHEDSRKSGKLTAHGREMTCSHCKQKGHNKRTCPDKNKTIDGGTPVTSTSTVRSSEVDGTGRGRSFDVARRGGGRGGVNGRMGRGRGMSEGLWGWFNCAQGSVLSNEPTSTSNGGPQFTSTQASVASNSQQPSSNQ